MSEYRKYFSLGLGTNNIIYVYYNIYIYKGLYPYISMTEKTTVYYNNMTCVCVYVYYDIVGTYT